MNEKIQKKLENIENQLTNVPNEQNQNMNLTDFHKQFENMDKLRLIKTQIKTIHKLNATFLPKNSIFKQILKENFKRALSAI